MKKLKTLYSAGDNIAVEPQIKQGLRGLYIIGRYFKNIVGLFFSASPNCQSVFAGNGKPIIHKSFAVSPRDKSGSKALPTAGQAAPYVIAWLDLNPLLYDLVNRIAKKTNASIISYREIGNE